MKPGLKDGSGRLYIFRQSKQCGFLRLAQHHLWTSHEKRYHISGLDHYKKQEFYEAHPTALLMTPDTNFEVEFFTGYVTSVKEEAWKLSFVSDSEFEDWLAKVRERSYFDSGIEPAATDRILTLSTCSHEFDNARFVLLGRLRSEFGK